MYQLNKLYLLFHQLTFISMMDTIKFVKNCCKTYYNYNNKVLLTTFEQGVEFVSRNRKI